MFPTPGAGGRRQRLIGALVIWREKSKGASERIENPSTPGQGIAPPLLRDLRGSNEAWLSFDRGLLAGRGGLTLRSTTVHGLAEQVAGGALRNVVAPGLAGRSCEGLDFVGGGGLWWGEGCVVSSEGETVDRGS